jgi:hypothetical protein
MKKTRWVNFVWDLAGTKLPAITVPRQFRLSLVKATERRQLQEVIEKSFALDPGWNAALHMIDAQMKSSIAAAFNPNRPPGWHFNTAPASSAVLCSWLTLMRRRNLFLGPAS